MRALTKKAKGVDPEKIKMMKAGAAAKADKVASASAKKKLNKSGEAAAAATSSITGPSPGPSPGLGDVFPRRHPSSTSAAAATATAAVATAAAAAAVESGGDAQTAAASGGDGGGSFGQLQQESSPNTSSGRESDTGWHPRGGEGGVGNFYRERGRGGDSRGEARAAPGAALEAAAAASGGFVALDVDPLADKETYDVSHFGHFVVSPHTVVHRGDDDNVRFRAARGIESLGLQQQQHQKQKHAAAAAADDDDNDDVDDGRLRGNTSPSPGLGPGLGPGIDDDGVVAVKGAALNPELVSYVNSIFKVSPDSAEGEGEDGGSRGRGGGEGGMAATGAGRRGDTSAAAEDGCGAGASGADADAADARDVGGMMTEAEQIIYELVMENEELKRHVTRLKSSRKSSEEPPVGVGVGGGVKDEMMTGFPQPSSVPNSPAPFFTGFATAANSRRQQGAACGAGAGAGASVFNGRVGGLADVFSSASAGENLFAVEDELFADHPEMAMTFLLRSRPFPGDDAAAGWGRGGKRPRVAGGDEGGAEWEGEGDGDAAAAAAAAAAARGGGVRWPFTPSVSRINASTCHPSLHPQCPCVRPPQWGALGIRINMKNNNV